MSAINNLQKVENPTGSELIQKLLELVNGPEYSKEARLWNSSSRNMQLLIWNLAKLPEGSAEYTNFKREWLQLSLPVKAALREAIHEIYQFLKQGDVCLKGNG